MFADLSPRASHGLSMMFDCTPREREDAFLRSPVHSRLASTKELAAYRKSIEGALPEGAIPNFSFDPTAHPEGSSIIFLEILAGWLGDVLWTYSGLPLKVLRNETDPHSQVSDWMKKTWTEIIAAFNRDIEGVDWAAFTTSSSEDRTQRHMELIRGFLAHVLSESTYDLLTIQWHSSVPL